MAADDTGPSKAIAGDDLEGRAYEVLEREFQEVRGRHRRPRRQRRRKHEGVVEAAAAGAAAAATMSPALVPRR
eukprot:101406-Chlamydomonas_euryale.AAC.2